jgi:hypothetical protein
MQGKGKDASGTPERGTSGMTGIVDGDTGGAAGAVTTPAMALDARTQPGGGEVGETGPAGVATPQAPSSQSRDTDEPEIRLDEAAQALIGQHLKAVYSEIVQQPVPDEFLKLLDDLERKERS